MDPAATTKVGITYTLDKETTDIHMLLDSMTAEAVLSTGLEKVHSLGTARSASGGVVLLVGGENAQGGVVAVYVDDDGDALIQSGELVASLVEAAPPAGGVLYGWITNAGDDILVLDHRNHRVLRLVDTNADGVVDAFSATVVLDSTQTHEIASTQSIAWDAQEDCVVLHELPGVHLEPLQKVVRARDTNADGRVDEIQVTLPTPEADRDVLGLPRAIRAGETVLTIVGRQSATIQVWSADPGSGAFLTLQGTVTHGAGQTSSQFTLASGAVQGDAYRLKDVTHDLESALEIVETAPGIVIDGVDPTGLDSTASTLVTLRGVGFTSGLTVGVAPTCEPIQAGHEDLAITLVSGTELTVLVPALSLPTQGPGLITLWDGADLVASARVRWTKP